MILGLLTEVLLRGLPTRNEPIRRLHVIPPSVSDTARDSAAAIDTN
jgi:hypothetical protein